MRYRLKTYGWKMDVNARSISNDLFGPVDFFYDQHKNVLNTFNLSVDLLDGTNLDIIVDEFIPGL